MQSIEKVKKPVANKSHNKPTTKSSEKSQILVTGSHKRMNTKVINFQSQNSVQNLREMQSPKVKATPKIN